MAESIELAAAYVQLVPSLKGVEDQIARALGGSPATDKAAKTLGKRIAEAISGAVTKGLDLGKKTAAAIRSAGETLRLLGLYAKDAASATAKELAPIGRAIKLVIGLVTGPLARAWGAVGSMASRALQPIHGALAKVGKTVGGWASAIGGKMSSALEPARTAILRVGATWALAGEMALKSVGAKLSPITSAVAGAASKAASAVGGAFSGVAGAAGRIVSAWAPVGGMITSAVSSGVGKIGGVIGSALSSGAGAAVSAAGRIGASVGNTLSGAIQTGVNAAGLAIAGLGAIIAANLGGAVARADLLNNFPKVMGNIGFSSEEAAGQIQRISDSLDGLPTSTDALVATAKGLAPLTGDLTSATEVALALNNALLGGGASATLAENAMEQFRQMLSVGTVDMAAWRSLVSAMPGQMDQLSKSILGAEGNSSALYQAMKDGEVSFDQFNAALVALNTEGYDGLASFSEQAQTATAGIGTAMTNVGNRVKKAIATVIEAIGVDAISGKINELTSGITGWGNKIAELVTKFKAVGADGIKDAIGPLSGLAPVIGGLLGLLGPLAAQIPIIGGAFSGLTGPVGLVIGLFAAMWTQSEGLRTAVSGAFGTLGGIFQSLSPVLSQVTTAFSTIAVVLGDALGQAITAIMPALSQMAQAIFPVLGQVIAALTPVLTELVSLFAGILVQAIQILAPILANLAQTLMPVILQVVQALIPPISQVIAALKPVVQEILPILGSILGTLVSVLGNIIAAVLPPLAAVLGKVISVLASLVASLAVAAVPTIRLFGTVVEAVINAIGTVFTWLWNNILSPVLEKISTGLTTLKNFIDVTVKPAIENAVKAMGDAFTKFKDTAKTAFDKIKEVAAKPINFVINTVYKGGIKKAFDTIAEKIGLDTRMPSVAPIPGYASGGVLPGYTPGRDIYHFTSHDGGGRLALSGGEAIMVPEWTRAVGGPRAVRAMNAAARSGRSLPLGDRGGWRGFADGGVWDKIRGQVSAGIDSVTSWVSSATDAVASIVSDPLGAVANLIKKPVDALMGSMPGGGFPKEIASYLPKTIIDGIGTFLKEKASTISASDLVTQARLAIGTPYVWGGVSMPGGLDCSGLIVWALRQMGHNVPRHTAATFQSNSVPVGSPVPGDLAFWGNPAHHVAIVSGPGMMVEAPTFGLNVREVPIYGGPTYGRFMYDEGGYLQPGLTMVENRTGKPEPVFTSSQWADIKNNQGFPDKITVRIGEREFHSYAADVADERIVYASREG